SYFYFYASYHNRELHSFPTRRSSDLRRIIHEIFRLPEPDRQALFRRGHFEFPSESVAPFRRQPGLGGTGCAAGEGRRGRFSLVRSEEHTSELQSRENLVCRLLLEKKK